MTRPLLIILALTATLALVGCQSPTRTYVPHRHHMVILDSTDPAAHGTHKSMRLDEPVGGPASSLDYVVTYTAPRQTPPFPFNEALVSWNIDCPPTAGYRIELRAAALDTGEWTPWLHVGAGGNRPVPAEHTQRCALGRVDIDVFRSDTYFGRVEVRVRGSADTAGGKPLTIRRLAICTSDIDRDPPPYAAPDKPVTPPPAAVRRLPVPFRNQLTDRPELAGRICSPACVAMLLAYHGVDAKSGDVAAACYDAANDIYGNWPRQIQTAYAFGVPGYLTRFSTWRDVERHVAQGRPLAISLRLREGDQFRGASYRPSGGHLIVITGFDANGHVHVNDPAFSTPDKGQLTLNRHDLGKAWLYNTGGVAYVVGE